MLKNRGRQWTLGSLWGRQWRRRGVALVLVVWGLMLAGPVWSQGKTEILWDEWGIPHIFAHQGDRLFEAFGWAQAQNHSDLLLTLYGEARGRAAEYWGEAFLPTDQYVRTMGIPQGGEAWWAAQSPSFQRHIQGFVTGINRYYQAHPDVSSPVLRQVLPVTPVDVMAHAQRLLLFQFALSPQVLARFSQGLTQAEDSPPLASNAWAIAPRYTQTQGSLVLAQPHLPWHGLWRLMEAQLVGPGINLTGVAFVGTPVLAMGFNDQLGWSLTVNDPRNVGWYALTRREGGYEWDGQVKRFDRRQEEIRVRQGEGQWRTVSWEVQETVAGTVIRHQGDQIYTVKVPGRERAGSLEQFWRMGQAQTLEDFTAAWQEQQVPLFNLLYGDRQGNIAYWYNTLTPMDGRPWLTRNSPQSLQGSADLPPDYYPSDRLPYLLNPRSGWLQNTNDPPWTSTFPPELDPQAYPNALAAPSLAFAPALLRTQASLKRLQQATETQPLTLDQWAALALDSRWEMAERIVPLVASAAKLLANPLGLEAADVLKTWDKRSDPDSRGAVLFMLWALTLGADNVLGGGWNPAEPLTSPSGMADINKSLAVLEGVAAQVKLLYGRLDVSWGEVVRLQMGNQNTPGRGGPSELGSFRVLNLKTNKDQQFVSVAGDTYVSLVAFDKLPQAKSVLVYGNASQPDSPHHGDQLTLYTQNQFHPVWRSPQALQGHVEKREVW